MQINSLNLSFSVQILPVPFQVHEQLAMRAVIFGEDLVPGVLCNQLSEVMAAGEEQNLPSHLLMNSNTSSLVHSRIGSGGVEKKSHNVRSQIPLLHNLVNGFCLNLSS